MYMFYELRKGPKLILIPLSCSKVATASASRLHCSYLLRKNISSEAKDALLANIPLQGRSYYRSQQGKTWVITVDFWSRKMAKKHRRDELYSTEDV